jgi:hypothetical protein
MRKWLLVWDVLRAALGTSAFKSFLVRALVLRVCCTASYKLHMHCVMPVLHCTGIAPARTAALRCTSLRRLAPARCASSRHCILRRHGCASTRRRACAYLRAFMAHGCLRGARRMAHAARANSPAAEEYSLSYQAENNGG